MNATVARDERTIMVENQSYRWGYFVLSYGLLLAVAWRSFGLGEGSWDLLALVVVGGLVSSGLQLRARTLNRHWGLVTAISIVMAVAIAALTLALRRA